MAYSAYCDTAVATKWWITGTGSTVNRLSEVMDDNPLGVEEADNPGNYQPWTTFMTETVEDAVYLIHLDLETGDGSTATTLLSFDVVRFDDGVSYIIKNNATLTLGELVSSYPKRGACWLIGNTSLGGYTLCDTGGAFNVYGSYLKFYSTNDVITVHNATIVNSILAGIAPNGDSTGYFYLLGNISVYSKVSFLGWSAVWIGAVPIIFDDIHIHGSIYGVYLNTMSASVIAPNINVTGYSISDVRLGTKTGMTLNVVDSLFSITTPLIGHDSGIITEQYTVNIHLTDKSGEAIADTATVACTSANVVTSGGNYYKCITAHTSGTFATDLAAGKWEQITDSTIISAAPAWLTSTAYVSAESVFSVNPTSGSIAEQAVTVRKWTGTSELETKYIFEFTFSETGYQTLVKNNVPILQAVDWRLEIQDLGHGGIRRPIFLIEE